MRGKLLPDQVAEVAVTFAPGSIIETYLPEIARTIAQVHAVQNRTFQQFETCLCVLPENKASDVCITSAKATLLMLHEYGIQSVVATVAYFPALTAAPAVFNCCLPMSVRACIDRQNSIGGKHIIRSHDRNMRNFTVYVTCGKICLKRIGHIAVESVIDGPYGSIFMQTAMAHEILNPTMSSLRQPETGVERFQYLISLFPIGCGVFAYLLSNQCSQFIAAIVIGRAVRNGATVIIQRIACPNAGVGIVQAVVVRIEVAFFPSKMQMSATATCDGHI